MSSLNKTILTGRLTQDPETRYTAKEQPVTHFSLAVERIKKGGEKEVDYINCTAWGPLAKICGEYLKKGRLVAVEGRLHSTKYTDKNGQKKTAFEVVTDNMQMLDWAKKEEAKA